ncbi:MAG: sulfite exporter TauE/SafE family protein [Gammaproteobacteria bacterium]|nr:sulfite exporter TauE/SafE family protein [Gammaproteobacteria bacterium]
MELLTYLLTGAAAGLMAGLLGIGGGLVIVPALALFFASQGFATETLMHFAVGTSLATIIPISISSLLAHHRRNSIDWQAVRGLVPGIMAGALAGAWLARQLGSPGLALLFGVFEILVAVHLLIGRQAGAHRALPGAAGLGVAGAVIGGISAMLGIGGGTLSVPFLLWNRVDIRTAVGTAATCGLPIAIAGAAGFAISGWKVAAPAGLNSGFIYWPAVFWIALASVPMAPVGARLAHSLPRTMLQRVFALLLALIGLKMIFGA